MNRPAHATISVAVNGEAGGVKITGRANVGCSVAFRRVLEHLRKTPVKRVFVFLQECLLMDSTFLGVLAKQGVDWFGKRGGHGGKIVLVAPSERVLDWIENLGVLGEFEVVSSEPGIQFVFRGVSPDANCDLYELTKTSLEAHETLIELHGENRDRFGGVTHLLAKDVTRKSRSEKQSS